MLKLLYITNGITGAGGLERVLAVKASYLADNLCYEVHILSLNEPNPKPFYKFSANINFHNIEVNGNAIGYFLKYRKGIKKALKSIKPAIISVCDDGLKAFFTPLILGKKIPIIYERHASIRLNFDKINVGLIKRPKNKVSYWLMKKLAANFDIFVVLTHGNLKEWDSKNLRVIANPLSFYPAATALLNQKRIIVVGSHSFNKGFDLLLDAWALLTAKFPEWQLTIYGKTDKQKTFVKYAQALNVSQSVLFFEPVATIEQEYLNSSFLVFPSRSEGFGMVLIEAMACGVPCISFDCPHGPADIITNGVDGFLVANGDIPALAKAIETLINNEALRKQMGAKAKENVQRFLPETIVKEWDNLFKNLVKV